MLTKSYVFLVFSLFVLQACSVAADLGIISPTQNNSSSQTTSSGSGQERRQTSSSQTRRERPITSSRTTRGGVTRTTSRDMRNNDNKNTGAPVASAVNIDTARAKIKSDGNVLITFSNDINKLAKDQKVFTSKDNIYGFIKRTKSLPKMLPQSLEYYRVKLSVKIDGKSGRTDDLKLYNHGRELIYKGRKHFRDYYGKSSFGFPIIPSKAYYDKLLKSANPIVNIKSQLYPIQIGRLFGRLTPGIHTVSVAFKVFAKTRRGGKEVADMKGIFTINVVNKTSYKNLKTTYTGFRNHYQAAASKADLNARINAEKQMLAKMTKAEQICYYVNKPPLGKLNCYQGPGKYIKFKLGRWRGKSATLWVKWPNYKGSKKIKYRGGLQGITINTIAKDMEIKIPYGAEVSLNKRIVIKKVRRSTRKTITIKWWHK
jgi:hypothetical protein